jgi:NADP-dependent 3-hydroxy acid dehydrogenase YdfG
MLSNAVAIITGASSGIGAATALKLAGRGARLSLLARSPERLAAVAARAHEQGARDVLALPGDLREETQVEHAITETRRRYGRVDILINSAGLSLNGAVDGYATADWRTVLDTNLTGTFLTCRAVLPAMKEQGAGQIINIASGAGRNGIKDMAAYCASKFGVIGFTEALALEVRNHNIRVSVLVPGSVATNFSRTAKRVGSAVVSPPADSGYSLTPDEVADVLVSMLEQPAQAWMSEVVLRPLNLELRRNSI